MRGDLDKAAAAAATGIELGIERKDAFGTAVVQTSEIQRDAMVGAFTGTAQRADAMFDELTRLGIDQFAGGARIISGWARAMGPDGVDTVDEVQEAFAAHSQGGRRIFSPLYLALLRISRPCTAVPTKRD